LSPEGVEYSGVEQFDYLASLSESNLETQGILVVTQWLGWQVYHKLGKEFVSGYRRVR